ncbi:hypothetical protein M514_05577 [Trichuris suis]|uniref:Uncharacterized protein n=1 Tax=Trichuris suis TaxID=68888 RepID=A0A085MS94_9BILA|nr:hypothetical protein M513_05577 [Trichuris suis]KFD60090.1 hypothetical protein M514_05577 [Trichuris suis]
MEHSKVCASRCKEKTVNYIAVCMSKRANGSHSKLGRHIGHRNGGEALTCLGKANSVSMTEKIPIAKRARFVIHPPLDVLMDGFNCVLSQR